jgi:CRP/FNR family transcriptional regulator
MKSIHNKIKKRIIISCSECPSFKNSIFVDLSINDLLSIQEHKTINFYPKGQNVFIQNNSSYGSYCIQSGQLKLSKLSKDGNESIVRLTNDGQMIGHSSVILDKNHYGSCSTITDSVLCFIPKKAFLDIIKKYSTVANRLIYLLSNQLRIAELSAASKSQRSFKQNLASLLANLFKLHGIIENNEMKLVLNLSRVEIASMLGTTTETVSRLMTELKKEKIIREKDKIIYILNREALEKIYQI